jgi:hypothetical protein
LLYQRNCCACGHFQASLLLLRLSE